MKNVTVSLDDATYRAARVRAAEAGRSLSSLVRDFLRDLGSSASEEDARHAEELRIRERIEGFKAGDRLSREDIHERQS